MSEFFESFKAAIPGAVVSLLISGIFLHYLQKYIDSKLDEEKKKQEEERKIRRERNEAEQDRRRAAGRMFFWLHRAIVKGEHNGELEAAFEAYQAAEEKQKDIDRRILAAYDTRIDT